MYRIFSYKINMDGYKCRCHMKVEAELRDGKEGPVFSMSGSVLPPNKKGYIMGGQMFDHIPEDKVDSSVYAFLIQMWKKYHLNDLHAGTPEQEKCLDEHREEIEALEPGYGHYHACCVVLGNYGLYEVDLDGKPYKYGHAWLYRPIPDEDLTKIRYVLDPSHSEEDIEEWLEKQ